MCFSATASFGAGTALLAVGVITLRKVTAPSQTPFAAIPLLFSIQQFAEGFLWLSLTDKNYQHWQAFSTYSFLFFAQVVWPIWIPLSILLQEKSNQRKILLRILTGIGMLLSLYLVWCLLNYPVKASIVSYHIHYTLSFPFAFSALSYVAYIIPTVIPPFISNNKKVPLLGVTIACSYLFTRVYYAQNFISVWCFFAAIISVLVLYIIIKIPSSRISPLPATPLA
jgi:hypothetical protein